MRLLVWYVNDNCYHERLLLWPVGPKGTRFWAIATPDYEDEGGVYVEHFRLGRDITRICALSLDGSRPYLTEDIYAFPAPVEETAFLNRVEAGQKEAVGYGADTGREVVQHPDKWITWDGDSRAFVWPQYDKPIRRMRGKGPGVPRRDEAVPVDREPGGANRGNDEVDTPRGSWRLSAPVPGLKVCPSLLNVSSPLMEPNSFDDWLILHDPVFQLASGFVVPFF